MTLFRPKAYWRKLSRNTMAEDWQLPRVGNSADPLRLGVLISGSGSGMEALLRHQQNSNCLHTTNVVISDRPDVTGLDKAGAMGVTAVVVPLPAIQDRDCLLYTSPSPRDRSLSRMPSSA